MPAYKKLLVDGTAPDPITTTLDIATDTDLSTTVTKTGDVTQVKIGSSGLGAYALPMLWPIVLSSATTAQVVVSFTPGVAGTIRKISAHTIVPATTTAKLASFTVAISAVAISGGVLTVTSTAAATVGNVISATAVGGLASFTASQAITVTAANVTAFAEGQIALAIFLSANA